jgi:hypothetical protein
MSHKLIFLFSLLFCGSAYAQPGIELFRLYDGGAADYEKFEDLYHRADGGYFLCGWSNQEAWIMRVEENGDPIWSSLHGATIFYSVIETDDGDVVAGGDLNGFAAKRFHQNGDVVWQRTYAAGRCQAMIELKAGQLVLCGNSSRHGYIMMITPDGEPIWANSYGDGQNYNYLYAMRETEGGIVAVGYTDLGGWGLKVDFEGNVVWSRSYRFNNDICCQSLVSCPDGGFAIGGYGVRPLGNQRPDVFILTRIDSNGFILFQKCYFYGAGSFFDAYSIAKYAGEGFVLVGFNNCHNISPWSEYPYALRVNNDGDSLWAYDFRDSVEQQPQGGQYNRLKSVIVQGDNQIIACGGFYNSQNGGSDGLLMRFEPDHLAPLIVLRQPEDSSLTVLIGDSVDFKVRAITRLRQELTYTWFCNGDSISDDTSVTVHFDSLGRDTVICRISVMGMSVEVKWYVTVKDFLIRSYSPDMLNLALRRGTVQNYDIVAAAIGDEPVLYNWNLADENNHSQDISDSSAATVEFRRSGNYSLEALAYRGASNDAVTWNIAVRSVIFNFFPEQQTLSVPPDTIINFEVIPFDPSDTTLTYNWIQDGEWVGSFPAVQMQFQGEGVHNATAIVSDSSDADTIVWNVSVVHPNSVANPVFQLSAFSFQLSPNPFNSRSTIRFGLDKSGPTLLTLHDLTGRTVRLLAQGRLSAGEHQVALDAAELPAGLYFLRLEAAGKVKVAKAVVIK